jgi:hypothetical protein
MNVWQINVMEIEYSKIYSVIALNTLSMMAHNSA